MNEHILVYQEILEGLKQEYSLFQKLISCCDYLRSIVDLAIGREKQREDSVIIEHTPNHKKDSDMKHLYQRKDGRWEYSAVESGHRVYLIASSKSKAVEKIQQYKQEKKEKEKTSLSKTTFVGWTHFWLKTYKTNSNNTKNYAGIIRNHLEPYFKNMPLSKLTPAMLQEFINKYPRNTRTVDYVYLTLRQSLKQAYINEKINRNLADMIVKPRKTSLPKRTGLSLSEQESIFRALPSFDEDIQYFVIFSLIAGTRRAETTKFILSDIDEEKNRISIRGTKTTLSARKIKVSKQFIDFLKKKHSVTQSSFFCRQVDFYTSAVKDVLVKAGLPDKTLHDLRHTASTNLMYLGWPDKERQAYLGHASIVMTNDIYTNLQEDITKEGLLKLYNNLYLQI
ncbi:MAG: site-specific integrase [Clostridia bacterium]|nr:site-specific integrase [Clostridia bacterium]